VRRGYFRGSGGEWPDRTVVITVPMSSNDIVLLKLARRGRNEPRPYGDGSP
jgi:hypothetical protein